MKKRVDSLTVNNINAAMQANERGMLRASSVIEAATVNGVFTLTHDLGELPDDFLFSPTSTVGAIWATPENRASWSSTSITLTASATGTARIYAVKRVL